MTEVHDPGQATVRGLLSTVATATGVIPRIRLPEIASDPADPGHPSREPVSPSMASQDLVAGTRFQVLGEIARGGMGSILKVHDPELGRDLALKFLLDRHKGDPDLVRRFVEEAQIGGQLQHPGIVPIHELGTFGDLRPYFTMKLVKGHTLAVLLDQRADPQSDQPRFLAIFEQICQTVAYAHARGVVHRDLKPSNVMVGGFGEVQVMDWGLAKILSPGGEQGPSPGDPAAPAAELETDPEMEIASPTVITTARSRAGDSDLSAAGSIFGTPSYMAPEQARGEANRVDERADVFAIGSILCEILTGSPVFTGESLDEIHRRTIQGATAGALRRLDASGADTELIELARHCLAVEPEDRPRDAGVVLEGLTVYLAGVRERLRASEVALAVEEGRVEEARRTAAAEHRSRRLTATLAAILVGLVVLGGAAYIWRQHARAEIWARTATAVNAALAESARLQGLAHSSSQSAVYWAEALAQAQRADDLLRHGEADATLHQQVERTLAELTRERAAFEVDRQLLSDLETARGAIDEHDGPGQADDAYTNAFRKAGLDLKTDDPLAAGAWIRERPESSELISYLDAWLDARLRAGLPEADLQRLVDVIRMADPDPWRDALRTNAISQVDGESGLLQELADDPEGLDRQPVTSLLLLSRLLRNRAGDLERAGTVLERAWERSPDDFWVNLELAAIYRRGREFAWVRKLLGSDRIEYPEVLESLRYLTAAVAIRPESSNAHNSLGYAFWVLGRATEAESEFRKALQFDPDNLWAHNTLGAVLMAQNRSDEAATEYREAIRIRPEHAWPRINLGHILQYDGRFDEAEAQFRQALQDNPGDAWARISLARLLDEVGREGEAEAEFREALRIEPNNPLAHCRLGLLLGQLGRYDEALVEVRRGHELGLRQKVWLPPSGKWVRQAERRVELSRRLPAVIRGDDVPSDLDERVEMALIASESRYYDASVRLFLKAWEELPDSPADSSVLHRFEAARAAILAADGQGQTPPPESDRDVLRQEAMIWLREELAHDSSLINLGPPAPRIFQELRDWRVDPKLASVREPQALAALPELEQAEWRAFWSDVDYLLREGPLDP